jgi:HSP20 family protein
MTDLYGQGSDRMRGESWRPAVDVFETEDSVVLRLELPGVVSQDVRVNTDGSRVRISGTRRIPGTGDVTRLHQMEIAFGPFRREITVPIPFDQDRVSAHLEDGFLSVSLPKVKKTRHDVKVESE